jgi:hypothetical protein
MADSEDVMGGTPRKYRLSEVRLLTRAPAGLEGAPAAIAGAAAVGLCVEDDRGSRTSTLVAHGTAVLAYVGVLPPQPYDCLCGETDFKAEASRELGMDWEGRANAVVVGPASRKEDALAALGFFLYKYNWADRIRLTHAGQVWDLHVHKPSRENGHLSLTLRRTTEYEPFLTQWRELGFYCHHDTRNMEYRLVGSRAGLKGFADLLRAYVADPRNAGLSEHEHYGPYGLEIMTWSHPGIDDHSISGPLAKLAELADIVEYRLGRAQPGARVSMREEFAPGAPFDLVLDVRADGFDPPSAEDEIK